MPSEELSAMKVFCLTKPYQYVMLFSILQRIHRVKITFNVVTLIKYQDVHFLFSYVYRYS